MVTSARTTSHPPVPKRETGFLNLEEVLLTASCYLLFFYRVLKSKT